MRIWFTSDTHFGHAKVIPYCERPFGSVEEMNSALTEKWNALVDPFDLVYHLGDIAFGPYEFLRDTLKGLNGCKIVVKGNHDAEGRLKKLVKEGVIVEWHRYLDIEIDGVTVLLHHMPIFMYEPMLCGHYHREIKMERKTINVGVDIWNMQPVSLGTIRQLLGEANHGQKNEG